MDTDTISSNSMVKTKIPKPPKQIKSTQVTAYKKSTSKIADDNQSETTPHTKPLRGITPKSIQSDDNSESPCKPPKQ